jgi:hypothetical protein
METNQILGLMIPDEIANSFELVDIKKNDHICELYLEEKPELIPKELSGRETVLDGYCNPLSLLSFPLKGVPTYLIIKRRRWQSKGESSHYSNEYYFNHPNIRATKEFAAFLKDIHGHTPDEYLRLWESYGNRG